MKTLRLTQAERYRGPLILVNKTHPLRCGPARRELRSVGGGVLLEKETAAQLKLLLGDSREIVSVSGFRSRQEQAELYGQCVEEKGTDFTEKYVAPPRSSEHESGLAIDVGENRQPIDFIRPRFPYQGPCQDFRKKAPFFGFIQRYEKGKEKITGIAHEPWHFRYVGFPHSLIIQEGGLSLEEYLTVLKQKQRLSWQCGSRTIEIRYIQAAAGDTEISLPDDRPHQISGNNADGFVLTLL